MSRILAVDSGSVRVGLAVSDELGLVATPLRSLPAQPEATLPARVAEVAREVKAAELVVGLPRRLDGGQGPEARQARALAGELRRQTGLPVALVDERLSSVEAERSLLAAGLRRERRRAAVDPIAATLILRSYLERRRRV